MSDPLHVETLTNTIVSCGNLLVREASRLFRPFGITPAQFNVLNLLALRGDNLRPSEIAQSLVVDPASTTYLMNQVEERGWIRRVEDADDRRASRVSLTAAGKAKVAEVRPVYEAGLAEIAGLLGSRPGMEATLALLSALPAVAVEATGRLCARHAALAEQEPATKARPARGKAPAAKAGGSSKAAVRRPRR